MDAEHVGHTRINLLQPSESLISKTWVLLDNASTVDVFVNPDLVKNVQVDPHRLHIICAAGSVYTNQIADFPSYGWVRYLQGVHNHPIFMTSDTEFSCYL